MKTEKNEKMLGTRTNELFQYTLFVIISIRFCYVNINVDYE